LGPFADIFRNCDRPGALAFRRERATLSSWRLAWEVLDATNAVDPCGCAHPIAIDHTRWLGSTVAEIAGEKAGNKPGVPVVSADKKRRRCKFRSARQRPGSSLEFIDALVEQGEIAAGHPSEERTPLAIAALQAARVMFPMAMKGLAGSSGPAVSGRR
jgi:hypothetical protein